MAFDIIVYGQEELYNALEIGYTSVALCDNSFVLPLKGGINYTAIGNVTASINIDEENYNKLGICCVGFMPTLLKESAAMVKEAKQPDLYTPSFSSYMSSYNMSSYFLTSFVTSYLYKYTGSFMTSYVYEYEYEYTGSFGSSYTTSFVSSYSTSFSLNMPFFMDAIEMEPHEECILVGGYGINLI